MTKDKAQKRVIRGRMAKTGERYSTARHFELGLHLSQSPIQETARTMTANGAAEVVTLVVPEPESIAVLDDDALAIEAALPARVAEPGMSDATVERATGRSWDAWFRLLDDWGAAQKAHAEIARHLEDAYGVDTWWSQSVTVGYERARGMRARHERPDGFSVNASKTFPVALERLFAALTEESERARWLDGIELRQRTSKPFSSARFDVLPGDTRLNVTFISRGPEKAVAQLQQERLASAEDVESWRATWKELLGALQAYLARTGDGLDH